MSPTWPPLLTMTQGKGKPFYLCLYEAEMAITLFTSSLQINKKKGGSQLIPILSRRYVTAIMISMPPLYLSKPRGGIKALPRLTFELST